MTCEAVCALAVGGLDPGGGAGLAADLRAITASGAFGCAAIAVTTIQSTHGLRSVHALPASQVEDQMTEVLRHQRVRAIKIGALGNASNVRAVARVLARATGVAVVVDTPMMPTRGDARLLGTGGLAVLAREILPRATLLTVNADEAQTFVGRRVQTATEAREAALELAESGPWAVLVKGGHLRDLEAIDTLVVGGRVVQLRARRLRMRAVHGAGCVLASLIAGRLAMRSHDDVDSSTLVGAVRWAKRVHHAALAHPWDVGGSLLVLVPRGHPRTRHGSAPNALA